MIELPQRIEGDRCVLRPLGDGDLAAYAKAFEDDPRLGADLGFETDPDVESLAGRVAKIEHGAREGDFVELAIASLDDDRLLGTITLHSFDWCHVRTEVGFWLAPSERGAGIATQATALSVEWAFSGLGMHRVEMTTLPESDRVLALAERLGFRREGLMRERNFERGRRCDIVMLAVLQDEWAFPLNQ